MKMLEGGGVRVPGGGTGLYGKADKTYLQWLQNCITTKAGDNGERRMLIVMVRKLRSGANVFG